MDVYVDVWIRNSDGCQTPGLGFAGGGSVGVQSSDSDSLLPPRAGEVNR
jgi:hypothetical protein